MRVLLSWLREFAPIQGDPIALGEQMSDLGMAVESIGYPGRGLDGIVVARVLQLRPHPKADRIQLVDVDAGDGEALQICCGAYNMAEGDLVPLATIGTVMPGGMKIERRKLRGEWSNGMLCSGSELGLGEDRSGIMVLAPGAQVGADLVGALGLEEDVLYDLEINPNRPDAMSVAGVARDLAARIGVAFTQLSPAPPGGTSRLGSEVPVEIVDPPLCGRLQARVVDGVRVEASPPWLARRLHLLGMRPVNIVVDVSNYVMLELGLPTHAYDLDRLSGPALRTRFAREAEQIVTLDGVERTLAPGDGVLTGADDVAVAIAGVMGGASAEISADTTSVLLELAWWDPMTIARTSKRLNLRSEASARFERGTDPEVLDLAAARFAELLAPGGASMAGAAGDARGDLPDRAPVRVRTSRVNALLGTELAGDEVRSLLEPIGFRIEPGDDDGVQEVSVPTFRPDTASEIDVIEEVARHHGYANIAPTVPQSARSGSLSTRQRERRTVRQALVGLGLDEAMPLAFLAPGDLHDAGLDPHGITLTNPLAAEESVLRPSLRPGLLKSVAHNASHRNLGVRFFEIGKVFGVPPQGQTLPDEREVLGVVLAGYEAAAALDTWRVLADALGFSGDSLVQGAVKGLHPGRSGSILVGDNPVGVLGEVDPEVAGAFGIAERVSVVEIDLDVLLALPHGRASYEPVSRYPSSDVDLAFVVPASIVASQVRDAIRVAAGDLLVGLRLFDVFRGPSVPDASRSLAFTLRLQASDRTLTDSETAAVRSRVIADVEAQLGATLRA